MKLGERSDIPESMRVLIDLIGEDLVLALARSHGGVSIHVPTLGRVHDSKLSALLGEDAVTKLAARFGGVTLKIPRCVEWLRGQRDREIRRRFDAGESSSQLALAYKLSTRAVFYILEASRVRGETPRSPTARRELQESLAERYDSGTSMEELARETAVPSRAVGRIIASRERAPDANS